MPSGPYPTAFDKPELAPTTSRSHNSAPRRSFPSTTTTSSSAPIPSAPPAPSPYTPQRPPSPAPSYHTLPPSTHTTVTPNTTLPTTTPLVTLAHTTPDAILSHLTVTNHIAPAPPHARTHAGGFSSRALSATTADGKVRYRVQPVSSVESKVLKVLPRTGGDGAREAQEEEEIARVVFTSRALRVVEWEGRRDGAGRRAEKVVVEVGFEELERRGRLDVGEGLRVEGTERGVGWVVVRGEETEGVEKTRDRGKVPGKFGTDERDKRRLKAGFEALRLVDWEGNVYAEYKNEVGLPATHKEERWGLISLRSRAVLLDEGVDRAFVTLAALLECYVKMFGLNQRENREWGNFAGSMLACTVM